MAGATDTTGTVGIVRAGAPVGARHNSARAIT